MARTIAARSCPTGDAGPIDLPALIRALCPGIHEPMLIKFDSEVGSFTMDGDIAVQLLKAMGHSGTVPGAILPGDIPGALARLKAIAEKGPAAGRPPAADSGDEPEAAVSLRQRAYPLIDLLTRAAARGKEVLWK